MLKEIMSLATRRGIELHEAREIENYIINVSRSHRRTSVNEMMLDLLLSREFVMEIIETLAFVELISDVKYIENKGDNLTFIIK